MSSYQGWVVSKLKEIVNITRIRDMMNQVLFFGGSSVKKQHLSVLSLLFQTDAIYPFVDGTPR
jgi:hypothetical protein